VQWLTFAGFYEKKIIIAFAASAQQHNLTGFLAHGKPAIACVEGHTEDIHNRNVPFLRLYNLIVLEVHQRKHVRI
jgi:hypothetical protein